MARIIVSDGTIAMGAEDFSFRRKTDTALLLEKAGCDVVELGRMKDSKEDAVIFKTVASLLKHAALCVDGGDSEESIKATYEAVKGAHLPIIKISLSTSVVLMEYSYHLKNEKFLEMVKALVSFACSLCDTVEFEAVDASRTDISFLKEVCATAEAAGADRVTVCDTAGILTPDEAGKLVREISEAVGNAAIIFAPSDKLQMAVADAAFAVKNGAVGIKTSTAPDSLSLDAFADLQRERGEDFGIDTGIDLSCVNTAVDGIRNWGDVTSADDRRIASEETLVLTVNSSVADVADGVKSLGYELNDDDLGKVFNEFAKVARSRETVGREELEAMIAANSMQVPETYVLSDYLINCSNSKRALAHVSLETREGILEGLGTGDGPIDAAFSALEQAIGHHYELDNFRIKAVTKGHGAVGSAFVRLRCDGVLYPGMGVSTDIVGASIQAYVSALNKIVYEDR